MVFAGSLPVAGQTSGRSSSDTKQRTCSSWSAVNGSVIRSAGGQSAAAQSAANARFGTAALSAGTGKPPSAMWNSPCVVRRSLFGLCRTPCGTRYEFRHGDEKLSTFTGSDMTRAMPSRSSTKVLAGSRGHSVRTDVAKIAVEKSLNAGIGRAQAASRAVDPSDNSCAAAGRRSPAGPSRPCCGSAVGPAPRV